MKFKVIKSNISEIINTDIVIWTTTPWTIPGNRALAYGNDLEYNLVEVKEIDDQSLAKIGDRIIIANDLMALALKDIGIAKTNIIKTFLGKDMSGTYCEHPFKSIGYDFIVPALEADFVNLEQGTGIVHVAPGHGADDYNLGIENDIDVVQTVEDDGKYNRNAIGFEGEHVFKVDLKIAEKLQSLNKLLYLGKLRHSYPPLMEIQGTLNFS